ncbi:SWIM zinc finger family protein [Nonomuraea sp. NPDC050451]
MGTDTLAMTTHTCSCREWVVLGQPCRKEQPWCRA